MHTSSLNLGAGGSPAVAHYVWVLSIFWIVGLAFVPTAFSARVCACVHQIFLIPPLVFCSWVTAFSVGAVVGLAQTGQGIFGQASLRTNAALPCGRGKV